MKKLFLKLSHYVEKFHIFYFIEISVATAMVIVNLIDAFKHDLYFLIPASYFLVFAIFLSLIEWSIHFKKSDSKVQILCIIASLITLFFVALSFFNKLYWLNDEPSDSLAFLIIYGTYAFLKFVICSAEHIRAIKLKKATRICETSYSLLGAFYTFYMFTVFLFEFSGIFFTGQEVNDFLEHLNAIIIILNIIALIHICYVAAKYFKNNKNN